MNDDDEEIIVIDQKPKNTLPVYTLPPHLERTLYNPKNYCPRCFENAIQLESYYCINCGYEWVVSVIDAWAAG